MMAEEVRNDSQATDLRKTLDKKSALGSTRCCEVEAKAGSVEGMRLSWWAVHQCRESLARGYMAANGLSKFCRT